MFSGWFTWGSKEEPVAKQENTNNLMREKEDWTHIPPHPGTEKQGSFADPDPDQPPVIPSGNTPTDALQALQAELENETAALNAEVMKWKAIKSGLPVLGVSHQPHESHSSWIQFITRQLKGFYDEIRDAVEPPHAYIKKLKDDRVNPVMKKLQALRNQLESQIEELSASKKNQPFPNKMEKQDMAKLCDAICNTSIEILEGYQALLSNIQSEIDYALAFRRDSKSVAEKALPFIISALIKYTLGLSIDIPVPEFDEQGRLINQELFNEIRQPVEGFVNKLLIDATRDVALAKTHVEATMKRLTENKYPGFHTPDKNVRDAANKLDTEEDKQKRKPLERTNSTPALRLR